MVTRAVGFHILDECRQPFGVRASCAPLGDQNLHMSCDLCAVRPDVPTLDRFLPSPVVPKGHDFFGQDTHAPVERRRQLYGSRAHQVGEFLEEVSWIIEAQQIQLLIRRNRFRIRVCPIQQHLN